jgi:hypothetical protein
LDRIPSVWTAVRSAHPPSSDSSASDPGAREALRLARGKLTARTDAVGIALRQAIDRYLTQPTPIVPTPPLPIPAGEPIG